ncbi:MAG: ubiquinone/menaquinone biosynthesis C-methylase UbiE [Alphaproteobacteria bacterium]|jgi:ubiquinone/menaquinone biosynthesis C-methylase UbiE
MLKYTADEIIQILANESWRGFALENLLELEKDIKIHVDNGYDMMGENYAHIFEELSAPSKKQIENFAIRVKDTFPKKHQLQVLDVGAGHGMRTVHLAAQDKVNLKAIELSEYFYGRHLLELEREGKLPFGCAMKGDMCDLPFEAATFDAIYCNAVLHHQLYLPGKNIGIEKAFTEFARVLMKGGQLYLLTLYGEDLHIRHESFFQSLNEQEMTKLAHRNLFQIDEMKQIEGKGPFGDQTRWLEVYLTKRNI